MTKQKNQWGGARVGAGRPATGRNPKPRKGITVFLNDADREKLETIVDVKKTTKTAIFRDAIIAEYDKIKTELEEAQNER